jgi:hypothetical protein
MELPLAHAALKSLNVGATGTKKTGMNKMGGISYVATSLTCHYGSADVLTKVIDVNLNQKELRTKMDILVSNLSKRVSDDDLRWWFGECGIVNNINIWVDSDNELLRFAIIEMRHSDDAKWAIEKRNGERFGGRILWVEKAPKHFGILRRLCIKALRRQHARRPLDSDLL